MGKRGTVTFAKSGQNTRTTQVFINLDNNANLDEGFPPFGKVVEGMNIVEKINSRHDEKPNQEQIQVHGNAYLRNNFPDLTRIVDVSFVDEPAKVLTKDEL